MDFYNEWCYGWCCCMCLRDIVEYDFDCGGVQDIFEDWKFCSCKKSFNFCGIFDVVEEVIYVEVFIKVKEFGVDDESDNGEEWIFIISVVDEDDDDLFDFIFYFGFDIGGWKFLGWCEFLLEECMCSFEVLEYFSKQLILK